MAKVQVILVGMPSGTVHDTEENPIVLRFAEGNDYEEAEWVVPSYPEQIPTYYLSELRVEEGRMMVYIEGPDFNSGPHTTDWVRSAYPRGKACSLVDLKAEAGQSRGLSISVEDGAIVVGELKIGSSSS